MIRAGWVGAVALATLVGCAAPAGRSVMVAETARDAGGPAWKTDIRAKLQKLVSCDFICKPLPDALACLQEDCGARMLLDPALQEEAAQRTPTLTLRLTQVPASLALDWTLRLSGMSYEFRDGAVFVSKSERLRTDLRTAIYDVGDLLAELPDHPAPEMDLLGRRVERKAGGPVSAVPMPFPLPMQSYDVCGAIRARVRPQSWEPGAGTGIEVRDDSLVVVQTEGAHDLIPAVLENLRSESRLALETRLRLYAVEPGKLDRVGESGRLLAEAAARGVSGQRAHNLRGTTWPATASRAGVFSGVLLDCRPVLAIDRRSVSLAARVALWLPAEEGSAPPERLRTFRAPVNVRAEMGRPVNVPLGALPGRKGRSELVVAELTVRAIEPERLAALLREEPEVAWRSELKTALEKEVGFEFVEKPLDECLQELSKLTEANMVIDPAISAPGGPGKRLITLRLTRVRFRVALQWVLRMGRLDYRFRDGAIFITGCDWLHSELIQRIYDVRELTDHSLDLPAPEVEEAGRLVAAEARPAELPVTGNVIRDPQQHDLRSVADIVRHFIEPASWGVGGTSAQEQNGLMIVFHLPDVQQRIAQLLAEMSLALRPEVRIDVALYSLKPGAVPADATAVEKSGRLLSRLATVGDNRQRLHAVGGTVRPGPAGGAPETLFTGVIVDFEPTLGGDRRSVSVAARILWAGEDHSVARLQGTLDIKVGQPTVVDLGAADGERIVAIVKATVRNSENTRTGQRF